MSFEISTFVTVKEAADELGIKARTLRKCLRRRGMPVTKMGHMSMIRRTRSVRLTLK